MKLQPVTNRNFQSGLLTLTEVIIALAIIVTVSAFLIGNMGGTRLQSALLRSGNELALNIKQARSLALGTQRFKGQANLPYGWGIHFFGNNSSYYIIFADLNGNNRRESSGNEDFQSIGLEPGVLITSTTIDDVVFTPPEPKVNLNPAQLQAVITLGGGGFSGRITIDNSGAISGFQ